MYWKIVGIIAFVIALGVSVFQYLQSDIQLDNKSTVIIQKEKSVSVPTNQSAPAPQKRQIGNL